jgi:hypothetical protein
MLCGELGSNTNCNRNCRWRLSKAIQRKHLSRWSVPGKTENSYQPIKADRAFPLFLSDECLQLKRTYRIKKTNYAYPESLTCKEPQIRALSAEPKAASLIVLELVMAPARRPEPSQGMAGRARG